MGNPLTDNKKKQDELDEKAQVAREKALVDAEKQREKKLKEEKKKDEEREKLKKEIKKEAKEELKEEELEMAATKVEQLNRDIKAMQSKKGSTDEDKVLLNRMMKERAQFNRGLPNDLNKLYPSQMTLEELKAYCEINKIECKKDDTTVLLRTRIQAFRNPAKAERLRMLEKMPLEGKIIR